MATAALGLVASVNSLRLLRISQLSISSLQRVYPVSDSRVAIVWIGNDPLLLLLVGLEFLTIGVRVGAAGAAAAEAAAALGVDVGVAAEDEAV